jgi:hypothetical protein
MTATSFNSITGLSSTNPEALGAVAVGSGTTTARADHVHPTTGLATSGANSNITSLSGLTTALSATQGGTAQSTYTTGDIIYASASNTLSKRTIGSTGQVLTVSGGVPTWSTPSTGADEIMVIMGAY